MHAALSIDLIYLIYLESRHWFETIGGCEVFVDPRRFKKEGDQTKSLQRIFYFHI